MDEEYKKEDLETIEPNINRTLDNNNKISDEFKDVARACFGRIFYMLGEKNFKRWIDKKHINAQIRELVIESMPKEVMEHHPSWAGYYTRGTNQIKLSPKANKDFTKDTNVHETFHLITDKGNSFPTFLDEGLTEYLKGMAINKPNAYRNNVKFVEFLHQNLGDLIIKSYLMGQPEKFDEQLLNLTNYDNSLSIEDIKKFYNSLNVFHNYTSNKAEKNAFIQKGATPEIIDRANKRCEISKQNYESVQPQVLSMCQKIVVGKVLEMTKNMEFYKMQQNGLTLDLETANKAISTLMKSLNIQNFLTDYNYEKVIEWETQTRSMAAEQILENTHVLIGYTGDERAARKQELIEKMLPISTVTKMQGPRGVISQTTTIPPSIRNTDITQQENMNIPSKLFEKNLTENMNITKYIEVFAKVVQVAKLDNNELENYLNKYNIRYFGNIGNFKTVNEQIINSISKIQRLSEIENERNRNTISSEYKSIGNGRFIEKRDNQIFFVELDEKGEFSEQELKIARQTLFFKDGTKLDINYRNGLQNLIIRLNNKEVKLGKTLSLQDIKDMELRKQFSKSFIDNIESGKYYKILNDAENPFEIKGVYYSADIDKRTREISFDKYISDIKDILPLIPESQRESLIEEATEKLLDKTYRIEKVKQNGKLVRDSKTQDAYNSIIKSVSELVNGNEDSKYHKAILLSNSKTLSNTRLNMVENNTKKAVVFFENNSAKITYNIVQNQKREFENKKYVQEAISQFKYGEFYHQEGDVPLEELPYHLAGVSVTQPIDTRNVVFSYNEFSNATKKLISEYPQNAQEPIFNSIFSIQMQKTYLLSKSDLKNQDLLEAFKNIHDTLKENIFSNIPIEQEKILDNLKVLNKFKIEKAKHGQKSAGIAFNNNHTKDMFYTFSDLIELVKNRGVREEALENEIKSIMNSHLEHHSKDENELPEQ